ncbi:MAG: hypothetical protein FWF54_01150 [Candidatus Azobacteroides sp.]|nr:hypothetical protein [Candidatus Azobacteroides sp.]
MKNLKYDLMFAAVIAVIFLPFVFSGDAYQWYINTNREHMLLMAFGKFAILATLGEMLGLRIKTGNYTEPNFGMFPRAVVWGILGVWIASAMKIFGSGTPILVQGLGVDSLVDAMKGAFTAKKLFGAFCISTAMNICYAPVFMTVHKITDAHILQNKGSIKSLIRPMPVSDIISSLNWRVLWGFVFKKTIPLFWIPAHTLTFSLPSDFQVLSAALLSIALGVILAIAAVMGKKK